MNPSVSQGAVLARACVPSDRAYFDIDAEAVGQYERWLDMSAVSVSVGQRPCITWSCLIARRLSRRSSEVFYGSGFASADRALPGDSERRGRDLLGWGLAACTRHLGILADHAPQNT